MNANSIIPRNLPRGVWVVAFSSTIIMSGLGMIVPLIPIYGKELGATATQLGFLMAGLFAGKLLAQLPAGFATDKVGRRPVLLFATLGYALTCAGYASSESPEALILFRTLQGISAGFFSVAARSLVSDLTGPRRRGTAQGVYSSSVSLGFVLGPAAAGSMAAAGIDITVPFWLSAALSLLAFFGLVFVAPKKPSRPPRESFPLRKRKPPPWQLGLLAGANMFFMAGLSVIMVLFPIAGKEEIAGGIAFVGPAYATAGISGLLIGPLAGRLSDKFGRNRIMILGAVLAAAEGASLLLFRNPFVIGFGFFLGGIGVAAFSNSLHAFLGDLTARARRGQVTGAVGLAGETGGIIGSLLAPFVWQLTDLKIPFGLQLVFTAMALAMIAALSRYKPSPKTGPAVPSEPVISG